ncbi:MAG TPA: M28 family peptidase [Actinomycetota bacterium]|nr:M28 family peptidase [Actinomycetota bacterium]
MRLRPIVSILTASLIAGSLAMPAQSAGANNAPQIPSITNMTYKPTPAIEAIPSTPDPAAVTKPNPTGDWNAYDLNVYETIMFPERQAGDTSADDAPGGAIAHGTCPIPTGCANHSLEFVKFWKQQMKKIVRPWGGAVHSYKFENVGSSVPPYVFASPSGKAFNLQAVIPGSVHPERMVIVSGHYDQTDSGPASAWDSAEGHATVFRIAKIMTDYWRKTGTRPAVSVKFTAWAGEESGTNGARAFIRDNIDPFPNLKVNAYFNLDPCAGAYPAFYRGNPAEQTPMVMQLGDPSQIVDPAQKKAMEDFNIQARDIVGEVFNHLDDSITDVPTAPEVFVSDEEAAESGVPSQETKIVTAIGGLALFSSDYARFEERGIPIFNLFPDVLGPHADGSPAQADALAILHTPNDNLLSLNAMTGVDQSGLTPSEGWYKGLEMCAHMHAWFMLQPNMGGAVARTKEAVAYFEVLSPTPAPLTAKKPLLFDAKGSHAFSGPATLKLVDPTKLKVSWNFGDGTKATGFPVKHAYAKKGAYTVTLTVKAPNGATDVMKMIVDVS